MQYRLGSGTWMPVDPGQDVAMDATSHIFTGLAAGRYHARVRSVGYSVSDTSDWVETSSRVQVDVRTVRIDDEIRVNRNAAVLLGCTNLDLDPDNDTCMMFNLEVQFQGVIDRTRDLEFALTDAPDHGRVTRSGDDPGALSVGETASWEHAEEAQWSYYHHDLAMDFFGTLPTNADVDATMDSFQFSFEGTTYTVNLVINQPPAVMDTPSTPGPFTRGTEQTFDVASDFTDPNTGDTLTYALGTVMVGSESTTAVTISGSTVTIDATAPAGTYTIPVEASDSGDDHGDLLTVTHTYMVMVTDTAAPMLESAVVNGDMLTLIYDEPLDDSSVPDKSAFTLAGTAVTVNAVAISGSMVTLTLSADVSAGGAVTVSYTKPDMNPLQDVVGNDAANFTPQMLFPPPPTGLTATADSPGELAVSWTAPSPAPTGGYRVQYSDDGSNWEPADPGQDVAAATTTHTFTGLAAGRYHARARAVYSGGDTSPWVETSSRVQVDVRTVRIDSEIRVNRNDLVRLGCTETGLDPDNDTCMMFNLEVQFQGVIDRTRGLEFALTDAPDHGHVNNANVDDLKPLLVGETVLWLDVQVAFWVYYHHDDAMRVLGIPPPSGADEDATTDSFQFSFEGTTYTVNLVINQPPAVAGTPSAGPFTAGTTATFDVAPDFTDPNSDTLTYALGTVAGPTTTAVDIDGSTVTIDATATVGEYTIPVTASDGEGLSVTHTYTVTVTTTDTRAPVFDSAVVNGNLLVLTYDEALDGGSVPAGGDFSIGGVPSVSVNTVAISGMMVTLTLSQAVTSGDTVTVSYTKPGTNPLRDAAGNESVGLTNAAGDE